MFARWSQVVVAHPWRVIAGWVVAAVVCVAFLPGLAKAVDTDQSSFLPGSAESSRAGAAAKAAFPDRPESTGILVFSRTDGRPLSAADSAEVAKVVTGLGTPAVPDVTAVTTGTNGVARGRQVQLGQVSFGTDANDTRTADAVKALRGRADAAVEGTGLRAGFTGQAPIAVDNADAVAKAAGVVGAATVGLIVVLLLVIFRSPAAAFLPVIAVGLVQVVASGLSGTAAKLFGYHVASFAQILMIVVLFGVGTDYILFLLFRYRERLRSGEDSRTAVAEALTRVGRAIVSAAAVVVVAFGTLLVDSLGSFRTLGPTLAIGVAVTLAAGLSLVPAILALVGPRIFWPSKSARPVAGGQPVGRVAALIGRLVGRRPAVTALASAAVLAALAVGGIGFKLDYDPVSQLPSGKESATAFSTLRTGFAPGVLNPVAVYLSADSGKGLDEAGTAAFARKLAAVPGVDSVRPALYSADRGTAELDVVLADDPYGAHALDTVAGPLRDAAHHGAPAGARALVGGPPAQYADIRHANSRDLGIALPLAAALIAVILALLLRSLAAPLFLLAAVFLGFAATFGATVGVFQHLQDKAGLQFTIPITLYLFVVAIGTDYNILTMERLREEIAAGSPPREAGEAAAARSAPAVASAGLVLAGSFAALMLAGVGFLTEMGFAVSVGIALTAFVMATLLVPSVAVLLGRRAWWPNRRAAPPVAAGEPAAGRAVAGTAAER